MNIPGIEGVTLEVFQYDVPPIPIADGRGYLGGSSTGAVLRVRSSDGIEGQALVGAFGDDTDWPITQIRDRIAPLLGGRALPAHARLWGEIDGLTGHGLPIDTAWSWVDLALWDLHGKMTGLPVCDLLGRIRDSVPVLATYPPRNTEPAGFVEEAARIVQLGIGAVKTHPGWLETSKVIETVQSIRSTVGDRIDLVLDANNGYDVPTALRISTGLDAAHYAWFEDPFPASEYWALEQLLGRSTTPVAMGDESSLRFRERVHLMTDHRLPIMRGSSRSLGVTGLFRLASTADALGRRCEFGVGGNASANAANLHAAVASASGYYEHWLPSHMHQVAAHSYPEPDRLGSVAPPTGPGLGVVLDEAWIASHLVERFDINAKDAV